MLDMITIRNTSSIHQLSGNISSNIHVGSEACDLINELNRIGKGISQGDWLEMNSNGGLMTLCLILIAND